jgi:sugar lactone lactonase YvrE
MKCPIQVFLGGSVAAVLSACGGGGPPPPPQLSLVAGSVTIAGSADAAGVNARFYAPSGTATDRFGALYVADTSNNTIRVVSTTRNVTTLAGTAGVVGHNDAIGAAASFNGPAGIALDSFNNIFVADTVNSTIRLITQSGVVSTFAGTALATGSLNGTGTAARFFLPSAIAIDGLNNLYVADTYNNTIRKITPAGVVTTLAGAPGIFGSADGTGGAASFNLPSGIATDSAGNIYVADTRNNTIRKITSLGVVTTLAGTAGVVGSADGVGAAATFNGPAGIVCDNFGNIYVADQGNSTIRKVTRTGTVTTVAGQPGVSGFTPGSLPGVIAHPTAVAFTFNTLYLTSGHAIAQITNVP